MSKKLPEMEIVRYEGDGHSMRIASRLALLGLLLLAGCTTGGTASDNDKPGSFYGGVTGGGSRP